VRVPWNRFGSHFLNSPFPEDRTFHNPLPSLRKDESIDCRAQVINVSVTWNVCDSGNDYQSGSKEHALQRLRMSLDIQRHILKNRVNPV
jgi:hypothetical protein